MSFRYHNNINRNTLRLALECIRKGNSHPAFFNDNICIPNLLSMGYSVKEAREYCVCGCVDVYKRQAQCCLVPVFQRCGLRPVYFKPALQPGWAAGGHLSPDGLRAEHRR